MTDKDFEEKIVKLIIISLLITACTSSKPVKLKELCYQKSDGVIICKDEKMTKAVDE